MNHSVTPLRVRLLAAFTISSIIAGGASNASAQAFVPGDLLVSSATYAGTSNTITIGQALPVPGGAATAIANGQYFQVFNNDTPDANFGITAPITISELTPAGADVLDIAVPTSNLVTSFSSKSELALNLSQDGTSVTFMGYSAAVNAIDVSNGDTPGGGTNAPIAGNGSTAAPTARGIGQLNADGTFADPTLVNTYAGNNGRAAILANGNYYTVGNSGATATNAYNTGVQIVTPGGALGSNSTSLGTFHYGNDAAAKIPKDNNFRGETIYNNTLFVTKGSGSNGADTVYQVGASGTLPTGSNNAISILPGFDTTSAKATGTALFHPFGLWFANAFTLYVSDEGDGILADTTNGLTGTNSLTGTNAVGLNAYAGLEKWSLIGGTWIMDYNLTNGLNIGQAYTVSGTNGGVAGSYTTATDGLRDITGKTNSDGTVSIYGITSTASTQDGTNNSVDEGTDPNKLVLITDVLADTNAAQVSGETFSNVETAQYGQVLRGVSFTPQAVAVPEPSTWALLGLGTLAGLVLLRSRRVQG